MYQHLFNSSCYGALNLTWRNTISHDSNTSCPRQTRETSRRPTNEKDFPVPHERQTRQERRSGCDRHLRSRHPSQHAFCPDQGKVPASVVALLAPFASLAHYAGALSDHSHPAPYAARLCRRTHRHLQPPAWTDVRIRYCSAILERGQ